MNVNTVRCPTSDIMKWVVESSRLAHLNDVWIVSVGPLCCKKKAAKRTSSLIPQAEGGGRRGGGGGEEKKATEQSQHRTLKSDIILSRLQLFH